LNTAVLALEDGTVFEGLSFGARAERAGDQIGAWSYPLLTWLGLGLTGISFVAAPLAAGWCALSLWLGQRQIALAKQRKPDVPKEEGESGRFQQLALTPFE
jgi:hypothetical protein